MPLQDDGEPADPDGVGPCPEPNVAAVWRRGRDSDGWDTWWHVDGTITKRGTRPMAGESVPFVMRMKPSKDRVVRDGAVHAADDHDRAAVK